MRTSAGKQRPTYVLSINEGLTEFLTGRISDEKFDVIHFNTTVLIRDRDVPRFMKELCSGKPHIFRGFDGEKTPQKLYHNQITILESKVNSFDRTDAEHLLYRYGEDAVVKLELICEYLFSRQAYEEIMPQLVKDTLNKKEDEKPAY